jgi:glycosyltransferase involved in cell wall biosynthesis
MKLTILTQYYPPEIGASQNRLSNLASHFVAAGHEVTVLTAMPNYPTGKIHEGYGGLLRREQKDGVAVIRTFIYPAQSAAVVPRLLNYCSFVFSAVLLGSFLLKQSDFLFVDSPPPFLGIAATWLSRLQKAKVIFNVADIWPESAVRVGAIRQDSWVHRFGLSLERFCYRHAWLVTGQSKSILHDIEQRFPLQRTLLLSNGADTNTFRPQDRTEVGRARLTCRNEFVVLYAGLHGLAQGLDQVLAAAQELQGEQDYRFVFVGDGPHKQSLVLRAQHAGIRNVTFLDAMPSAAMPGLLAAADLVIVPLAMDIPGAVPSKLYEAMAMGRPFVLVACGEAAEIVKNHNAGMVVEPGQVASLVQTIRTLRSCPELAQTLSENARLAVVEHFDRAKIARSFIRYLESQISCWPTEGSSTNGITRLTPIDEKSDSGAVVVTKRIGVAD